MTGENFLPTVAPKKMKEALAEFMESSGGVDRQKGHPEVCALKALCTAQLL